MNSIKPKLNLFDLTMIVISLVIGIGIFRTPSVIAQSINDPLFFILAWIVGGIISFIGALVYAELGSRFQKPGGYYKIVAENYNPVLAFMLNWVAIFINGAGAANVAIIGAEYFNPILKYYIHYDVSSNYIAIILITILMFLNFLGIKTGARIQNILTIIKIFLILLIISSLFFVDKSNNFEIINKNNNNLINFGIGLISVFYTYGGYQSTMNFGGDIINSNKNLPKGILFGSIIILSLYLLINLTYIKILGIEGIKNSKLVAASTAEVIFGWYGYYFVSITIFLSALGFLNVNLMQTPRSYYAMAEDRVLPKIFLNFNPKTQVQEFALFFYWITIIISLIFLSTFEKILNYVMFTDSITIAVVASTIFILRNKQKNHEGYKMIGFPFLPILFIIILLSISFFVLISSTESALFGIAIFLIGYPVFKIMRYIHK